MDNENTVLSMVVKCREYLVQTMEKHGNTQCSNTLTLFGKINRILRYNYHK